MILSKNQRNKFLIKMSFLHKKIKIINQKKFNLLLLIFNQYNCNHRDIIITVNKIKPTRVILKIINNKQKILLKILSNHNKHSSNNKNNKLSNNSNLKLNNLNKLKKSK